MARKWSGLLVLCGLLVFARDAFAEGGRAAPGFENNWGELIGFAVVVLLFVVLGLVIFVKLSTRAFRYARDVRREAATRPVFPTARVANQDARETLDSKRA